MPKLESNISNFHVKQVKLTHQDLLNMISSHGINIPNCTSLKITCKSKNSSIECNNVKEDDFITFAWNSFNQG